jgi:hypothetical protein
MKNIKWTISDYTKLKAIMNVTNHYSGMPMEVLLDIPRQSYKSWWDRPAIDFELKDPIEEKLLKNINCDDDIDKFFFKALDGIGMVDNLKLDLATMVKDHYLEREKSRMFYPTLGFRDVIGNAPVVFGTMSIPKPVDIIPQK